MQTWKKKRVVSQLALACALANASQENAKDISGSTYNTFGYDNTASTPWYYGYADWKSSLDGEWYTLNDCADGQTNSSTLFNSTINGMITSGCMDSTCSENDGTQYDRFSLTIDNTTIRIPTSIMLMML